MISEQFMQLGRWDLRLSPDTPMTIRQMLEPGDQIVITPTRTPFGGYPAEGDFSTITSGYEDDIDSILNSARFRGPILEVANRKTELSGHGMLWYLGNSNGHGPFTRITSVSARTWTQHLAFVDNPPDSVHDGWNGLTKVSGVSLPAGTYPDASTTTDDLPKNVLQRLLALASYLDVEFYVDPQGNFRHGGLDALFQSTPQVILMADEEGRDLDLIGLRLMEIDKSTDWWNTTSGGYAAYTGGGSWGGSSVDRNTVHGADGGNYFYLSGPEELNDLVSATPVATRLADQYAAAHETISASVDTYDPGRWMMPGDYLWAYDPVNEIYDNTEATTYHGMHVTPKKLRLYGMDWSVRQGMGVYRIPKDHGPSGGSGDNPPVLDLTDYVEFEDSPCRLDLGAWKRSYDQ